MSTLTLVNLTKKFGGIAAVSDVNLAVGDGEFLCILGPSGCGKSTALRMIGGFEEPTTGDVRIDDGSVVNLPPNHRPTAMVFQKYTLWPHMKIFENIAFGLQLRHLPTTTIQQKVQDALDLVGLSTYGSRFPTQLSGGEQQRIALARALVLEPKILLLDEPFSNLDALLRVRLREELRRIQRQVHITAIFVTHDQEEALSLADRIAVMNKGHVEQLDQPSVIYANPRTLFVADFIGTMNLLPAMIKDHQIQIGNQRLTLTGTIPSESRDDQRVTVAIRPEDLALIPTADPDQDGVWRGAISQLIDLGHYRKAIVDVPGVGQIKVYLSKSAAISENEEIALYPIRYLIYCDEQPPIEVHQQLRAGILAFH